MRKTLGIATLTLTLCCPALAGEIPTPPAPQPQTTTVAEPTTSGVIEEPTTPGEIHTPGISELLTETAVELLAILPKLL
jgi:hypothetical protein